MEAQPVALPNQPEEIELISLNRFIFLNLITFNLYSLWWTYKAWRFFKNNDGSDIQPALRAIFGLFTLIFLFYKIKDFARHYGSRESYSSGMLFTGAIVTSLFSFFPGYWMFLAQLGCYFYIRPFAALNYGIGHNKKYKVLMNGKLNAPQIVLTVVGGLIWLWVFYWIYKQNLPK